MPGNFDYEKFSEIKQKIKKSNIKLNNKIK